MKIIKFKFSNIRSRRLIQNVLKPVRLYDNMVSRPIKANLRADVYVCGFPCQSFSTAGKRRGAEDSRGSLMWTVAERIAVERPKSFVLENVPGLVQQFPELFQCLLAMLRVNDTYEVKWDIMHTLVHGGLPQQRTRVYVVGVLRSALRSSFQFPGRHPAPQKLSQVLTPDCNSVEQLNLHGKTCLKNIEKTLQELERQGVNPLRKDIRFKTTSVL